MHVNLRALALLVGFGALLVMAGSSNGSGWFHAAEAASTVLILLGLAGVLRERLPRRR